MKNRFATTIVFLLIALFPGLVSAEYFALLIGVGVDQQGENKLSGPSYDVAALHSLLTNQYSIPKGNIVQLVDEKAKKKAILQEMRNLYNKSKKGDQIFIYFSGHGVSALTANIGNLDLPHNSGALVPYDIGPNGDVSNQLIIGKRDLRPLITKLDKGGRMVFAMVDACYSGQTIRGISSLFKDVNTPKSKNYNLTAEQMKLLAMSGMGGVDQGSIVAVKKDNDTYPYKNVFYISAASQGEVAQDIGWKNNKHTIDGNPHGILTDTFLRALSSNKADKNNDGVFSYSEIYQKVKEGTVALSSSLDKYRRHTPNALPENGTIYEKVFFASPVSAQTITNVSSFASKQKLRVSIDSNLTGFNLAPTGNGRKTLFEIVKSNPDYTIRVPHQSISLNPIAVFDNNERLVISYSTVSEAKKALPKLLDNRSIVRQLIHKKYPQSRFNALVDLKGKQGDMIFQGEELSFTLQAEKDAYFLLLNISPDGLVNIIYPYYSNEFVKTTKGEFVDLDGLGTVVSPFGTDTLKLIAFHKKPRGIKQFFEKEDIQPGTHLYFELEKLLGISGSQKSQISNSRDISQHTIWVESVKQQK